MIKDLRTKNIQKATGRGVIKLLQEYDEKDIFLQRAKGGDEMLLSSRGKAFCVDCKGGEVSGWVQSKFAGDKAAARRARGERDNDEAGRARPPNMSVGNRGGRRRQAPLELH